MNGYFSRLIKQTGIKLAQQGESKAYRQQGSDNILVQPSVTPDQPESLEVEEVIEVTETPGSAAPNHHEIAKSMDKGNLKDSAEKTVKREASYSPRASEQRKAPSSPEIIIPPKDEISEHANSSHETIVTVENNFVPRKPVQADEKKQTQGKKVDLANSEKPEREASSLLKKIETVTELESKPKGHDESLLADQQTVTQRSIISETAGSPSFEQHVYISQLPDSYKKAIKEWLVSPTDGSKHQVSSREKLKATVKKKQNTSVILKPKPAKADSFPDKQIGNEQFKTRDLHLSVGNINLTIEEPKQVNQQPPKVINKPAPRQQYGSSRLSRHYVRVR